jgi:hypothetical protein
MQECAGIENGRDAVVRSPPSLHSSDSLSLLLPSSNDQCSMIQYPSPASA